MKPDEYQYGTATVTPGSNGDFVDDPRYQGDIDFVYVLDASVTGQATLHIDAVPTQNATNYQEGQINGPWDLTVPA